jgi:hypothetical protein
VQLDSLGCRSALEAVGAAGAVREHDLYAFVIAGWEGVLELRRRERRAVSDDSPPP